MFKLLKLLPGLLAGRSGQGNVRHLAAFKKYLSPYRKGLCIMVLCMAAGSLVSLAPPVVYKHLVDDVLNAPPGPARVSGFILAVLLLVAIRFITTAGSIASHIIRSDTTARAATDLETAVYRKLDILPIAYHDAHPPGDLIPLLYSDPGNIIGTFTGLIPMLIESIGKAVIIFFIIVSLLWWAGLLGLLPLIPAGMLVMWNVRHFKKLSDRIFKRQQHLYSKTLELLEGLRIIRIFGNTVSERRRFDSIQNELLGYQILINRRMAWINPLIEIVAKLGGVVIFLAGASMLVTGKSINGSPVTLGFLFMLMSYVWQLAYPIMNLGGMSTSLGGAMSSAERLAALLDAPQASFSNEIKPEDGIPAIRFREVTFGYSDAHSVLRSVSFEIPDGRIIGLIGKSGAGKTTMAQLICGMYAPGSGQITVYDQPFAPVMQASIPPLISLAYQDPMLFHGTIRENVAYGWPSASDEDVWNVLASVEAGEFVRQLPMKLDTILGEEGFSLSAGEKQRISLARALLPPARIVILDEATSQIDLETEIRIFEKSSQIFKGKTVLIISHRLHLMKHVDQVLLLDRGSITAYRHLDEAIAHMMEYPDRIRRSLDLDS